jgi:hypothetical protein
MSFAEFSLVNITKTYLTGLFLRSNENANKLKFIRVYFFLKY